MVDVFRGELTPEKWALARRVLAGEHPGGSTLRFAAREAGVTAGCLREWIERSRERRVGDDAWIWEIAEVAGDADRVKAQVLEDRLWDRAMNGDATKTYERNGKGEKVLTKVVVKPSDKATLTLLEKLDPDYRKGGSGMHDLLDAESVYEMVSAAIRVKRAELKLSENVNALPGSEKVVDGEFDELGV